jgi:hypothetical protein
MVKESHNTLADTTINGTNGFYASKVSEASLGATFAIKA